jgi:spore germination protein YaaH
MVWAVWAGTVLLALMPLAASARPFVFGYAAWWVPQAQTVQALPHVDRIKFIEIRLDPEGRLTERHGWPSEWQELRQAALSRGVPIDLSLTQFAPADFNALFGSPQRIARLTREVMLLAADAAVSGIHLDVEMVGAVDAQATLNYRAFVLDLSRRLKAMEPGRLLSVFLIYAKDRHVYDAATLAVVDHVVVQGYDAHWVNSEVAGPIAPLQGPDVVTWESMLRLARSLGVPSQRLLMGFPTFGYEWKVQPCHPRGTRIAPGETTVFGRVHLPKAPQLRNSVVGRVLAHGVQYDVPTGSAYYRVDAQDGSCVVGWFEDWWTLQRKLDWLEREQLAGIAFFPLGYDDTDLVALTARRFRSMPTPR